MLNNVSGIESDSFRKVETRLFPTPLSEFKDSAKRLLSKAITGYPGIERRFCYDSGTVLIVDQAERINSDQMFQLLFHICDNGGKLLLVEGSKNSQVHSRETYFDCIASHIDSLEHRFSLQYYSSFAKDFVVELQQAQQSLEYNHNPISLDL